jgi:hypothetical protein
LVFCSRPWQEGWQVHPAELSSGLPEIPETFASKAAALAAARKLIREQRAAGREMFGVVSSETKQAINELRAQRAGFSVSPVAAGTWQLMHNGEMVGNTYPSLATCWKLAADIADREQRGEADPLMALAERAKRDRECEVRIREARIPAGADLSSGGQCFLHSAMACPPPTRPALIAAPGAASSPTRDVGPAAGSRLEFFNGCISSGRVHVRDLQNILSLRRRRG